MTTTPRATITDYMPGDLLFFGKLEGDMFDKVISDWTNSEFVHVAIAVSAMQKVEALCSGIVRSPIDGRSVAGVYRYTDHASPLVAANLAKALEWLCNQIGSVYGWGDIANALMGKFIHGISIDINQHFDCSALACEFLILAGGVDMGTLLNPHQVTPALLAKQLHVVAGNK